jgi:hypothetical protein
MRFPFFVVDGRLMREIVRARRRFRKTLPAAEPKNSYVYVPHMPHRHTLTE